jgi:hypothetical protein
MPSLDTLAPPDLDTADADLADPFAFPAADAAPPSAPAPRIAFTPASPRSREDGWTPQRQHDFIETLADTGSVTRAALAVGMTRESAYSLRRRKDARGFREAWEAAQDIATGRLADACLERAIYGEQIPIVHNGEIIGHRTRHSDALAIFLLKARDPFVHGGLWLPSRRELDRMNDPWLLNPLPNALRRLPRLLARLLGASAAPARAGPEDHETP